MRKWLMALVLGLMPCVGLAQQYDTNGNLKTKAAQGDGTLTATSYWTFRLSDGTSFLDPRVITGFPDNEPFNVAQWGGVAPTAATALADNFANPTSPPIGAFSFIWDGANWDRWTGAVTQSGSWTVTVTDGAGALNVIVDSSALPTGAATAALQDGIVKDGTGDTTQANVSSGRLHVDGSGVTQPISGTVTVGTFPDNEPFNLAQIAGTATSVNDGDSDAGSQRVVVAPNQTASANNDGACVSVSSSTTLLSSFATRKGFALFARETNTDVVYVKMGGTATSSDFPLPAGSAFNMMAGPVVYTGVIDAIAASGTQSVCVVEF